MFGDLAEFESWFDFGSIVGAENMDQAARELAEKEKRNEIVTKLHHLLRPFIMRRVKQDVSLELPKKKEILLWAQMKPKQASFDQGLRERTLGPILQELSQKKCAAPPSADPAASPVVAPLSPLALSRCSPSPMRAAAGVDSRPPRPHAPPLAPANPLFRSLRLSRSGAVKGKGASLNNILMQMRKNCNHPDLIDGDASGDADYPPAAQLEAECGKLALLARLLERLKRGGHRTLLFSQMTKMLDIFESYFEERGVRYCRIDGSSKYEERRASIEEFNDPKSDCFVFLLSTRAGGCARGMGESAPAARPGAGCGRAGAARAAPPAHACPSAPPDRLGINLTSADTVVIYDSDWNPHADLQASRPPRTRRGNGGGSAHAPPASLTPRPPHTHPHTRQAMDRVHRIGQTKPVHVYRLATAHSVEARMLKRAQSKMVLEKVVMAQGGFHTKEKMKLNANELLQLFTDDVEGAEGFPQSADISDADLNVRADPPAGAPRARRRFSLVRAARLRPRLSRSRPRNHLAAQLIMDRRDMVADPSGKGKAKAPPSRGKGFEARPVRGSPSRSGLLACAELLGGGASRRRRVTRPPRPRAGDRGQEQQVPPLPPRHRRHQGGGFGVSEAAARGRWRASVMAAHLEWRREGAEGMQSVCCRRLALLLRQQPVPQQPTKHNNNKLL